MSPGTKTNANDLPAMVPVDSRPAVVRAAQSPQLSSSNPWMHSAMLTILASTEDVAVMAASAIISPYQEEAVGTAVGSVESSESTESTAVPTDSSTSSRCPSA